MSDDWIRQTRLNMSTIIIFVWKSKFGVGDGNWVPRQ